MGGSIAGGVGRVLGDVATFGTNELAGNPIGNLASSGSLSGAKSPSVPRIGQQSPLDMLTSTGGAPLLSNIAMGGNVDDALAAHLGVPKAEFLDALNGRNSYLSPQAIEGIRSVRAQLTQVQSNTEMRQATVDKLVKDFPNYMATQIPKYKGIADEATMQAANLALQKVGAKYAAGGQLSSGAMAAASARTGAEFAQNNLQYGTQMAMQDFGNQYSEASALRNFQMKMMGQGAEQGFNAVQNALQRNQQGQEFGSNQAFQYQQGQQQQSNAMFGALGNLGGMYLGSKLFGPTGAYGAGANATGGTGDTNLGIGAPRLNINNNNANAGVNA